MRRVVCTAFSLLLFMSFASAQIPSGNVFFGYSYYNTSLANTNRASLNGWEASVEGRVLPFIGIVADFSSQYGSQDFPAVFNCPSGPPLCGASGTVSAHVTETNILFGPRFSMSVKKFRPFAEFEFGVGHVSSNGFGSDTAFATAVGGGLDYRIIRPIAWRFEGDFVSTRFFSVSQNNVRLSTGIVLRF